LAIISVNKKGSFIRYRSTHFHYALTYVIITGLVLLFLNIYSSQINQKLFYKIKESSMLEKCQFAAAEISSLEVLNHTTVSNAVADIVDIRNMRFIVTDQYSHTIYDSSGAEASIMLFPEIVLALEGNDVFSWNYRDGSMQSNAATPVYSYGTLIGCVYIMEFDVEQGVLIQTLQTNTLTITLVLEVLVILYSMMFSSAFTRRVKRIMTSMRIIREGDYTHRVKMGGHDELTVLGDEFNDLTERLFTSEKKRNQFVSDASHELKTPLASIKLLTDSILQNDMDIDTLREFVSDIGNEAERLNRMSQKLLSLSKIESQEESNYEIVSVAPTIERVTRMLSGTAEHNQIEIQLDIQQDCPILIPEDDLYQIIFNLVENGIKYNVPHGKLMISLHREQDNAVIRIQDTGVGIAEESLEHIFERFYRVDKARSRDTGGSGLGLAIVRNMVERYRGTIEVKSTPGLGTTFILSFFIFDTEEPA